MVVAGRQKGGEAGLARVTESFQNVLNGSTRNAFLERSEWPLIYSTGGVTGTLQVVACTVR